MKLNNYLSLNLFSFTGYVYILLLFYMVITSELYTHNIKLLDNFIYLSLDDICGIHALCFLMTLLLLLLFLIEYFLHKTKKIEKKITWNSIIYKIFFYIGFISSSINILFYILFYCLLVCNTH